jgi:hypothetical protein
MAGRIDLTGVLTGCLLVTAFAAAPAVAQSSDANAENQVNASSPGVLPTGQELDVHLQTPLDSETANVEDRFETTTVVDLTQDGRVLVPAGAIIRGVVQSVDRASRTDRTGELTLAFDELVVEGKSYPIRALPTDVVKSEGLKGETGRIAAGAGVGAIVGGIIGGVKGALAGILIGAGGTIVATEGKDVELEPGTMLRIRLQEPVDVNP